MLPTYHVWRVHQKQPSRHRVESDHFFRLGLREPLAPIKPLAARSGAIVKAAMQPPPDNKELLADGGWVKTMWGVVWCGLRLGLRRVGENTFSGWNLVSDWEIWGGECSWIIGNIWSSTPFLELMILHHPYDPAFLEGSALTRKVILFLQLHRFVDC